MSESSASPPISNPVDAPRTDERVGEVLGVRRCSHCRYNLRGQPIVRERHYGLIMVRCPECSAVASLEEYPLLARTTKRWKVLLLLLWVLLMPVGLLATGVTGAVLSQGFWGHESELENLISNEYVTWREAEKDAGRTLASPPTWMVRNQADQEPPLGYVETAWLGAQDRGDFIRRVGGWWRCLDWPDSWILVCFMVWLLLLGLFWGAMLSRSSRWLVFFFILLGLGAVWLVFYSSEPGSERILAGVNNWTGWGGWQDAFSARMEWMRPYQLRLAACVTFSFLAAGIVLHRPLMWVLLHLLIHSHWSALRTWPKAAPLSHHPSERLA